LKMGKPTQIGAGRRLLAVIPLVLSLWCRIWGLDPDRRVDQYPMDQWEISTGIPSNTVISIAQTPDGYLWIGTSRGLVHFDGLEFVPPPPDRDGVCVPREIRTLLLDRQGRLWIGSPEGLTLYHSPIGRFKTFTHTDGITGDGIRCLKEDMRGNLWISFTSSYVNRFSDGEFTAFNASHGLLGKKINAIVENRQGHLLFGSRENGVFIYRDGKFSPYPIAGLASRLIITMYEDQDGDLWVGTNDGLFRLTGKTGETGSEIERYSVSHGLTHNYITTIHQDSEKNLWVGTHKGLNRLKKREAGPLVFESLLRPFCISCLFEDREKSLWIGTDDAGMKRLRDGKFTAYAPLEEYPEVIPLSLFEDRQGDTWIGTFDGKLFHCRQSRIIESIRIPELVGTSIAAIAEDAQGNLWLGTLGKGVMQRKGRRIVPFTTQQGLADNMVTSIYRDSRDNLWFSTFDGVSVRRHPGGIIQSFNSRHELPGKVVHNVYEDKRHNIWIATDRGIMVLKDGQTARKDRTFYLTGVSVTCIYEDPSDPGAEGQVYWIATDGAGLTRLSLKNGSPNITSCTMAQGMTTNAVYQFLEDQQGNFWLMSDSGILRVGKGELNRFAGGGRDRVNCTSFGVSDGLKSLEFDNVSSRNSALKTRNGEFWFITKKGISIVNPAKVRIDKSPPPVVIEQVLFDRQSVFPHPGAAAGPLTCKGITNFSFHFTAPTFLSPGKVRFKYRLEGEDRQWVFLLPGPGQERIARYQDLSPGTYTFRVTAGSAEEVWNQVGASLTFTLKPLFYQTALFKTAVLLLLLLLLAAALYIYTKRPLEKRPKYKGTPLNPYFAEECIKKLKHLMEVEKLYTDADISLQSLADKISITPHQLSQLLNEKLNHNFADFINSYRIEEARQILQGPKGARQRMTAVAAAVGFNTLAAFYSAFKKYTAMTPAQYKRKHHK
jgi:ligand-binding sensor domain-containing protein/AraC-like DNA-binding protein